MKALTIVRKPAHYCEEISHNWSIQYKNNNFDETYCILCYIAAITEREDLYSAYFNEKSNFFDLT